MLAYLVKLVDTYGDLIRTTTSILLVVGSAFGAFIAIRNYVKSSRSNRTKNAMSLVKHYIEKTIPLMSFILSVADCKNLEDKISRIMEKEKKLLFYTDEMNKLFGNSDILTEYKHLYDKIKLREMYDLYSSRYSRIEEISYFMQNIAKPALDSNDKNQIDAAKQKFKDHIITYTIAAARNNLEYVAQAFLEIGNQKLVYPSLHQTYLRFVRFLYIDITKYNETKSEKYFINVIKLYNIWNESTKK